MSDNNWSKVNQSLAETDDAIRDLGLVFESVAQSSPNYPEVCELRICSTCDAITFPSGLAQMRKCMPDCPNCGGSLWGYRPMFGVVVDGVWVDSRRFLREFRYMWE